MVQKVQDKAMSLDVAILKEIRKEMRRYSNRDRRKRDFLIKLHTLVCELEREAYEALQDEQRQKP
jgi:hypothetical protein